MTRENWETLNVHSRHHVLSFSLIKNKTHRNRRHKINTQCKVEDSTKLNEMHANNIKNACPKMYVNAWSSPLGKPKILILIRSLITPPQRVRDFHFVGLIPFPHRNSPTTFQLVHPKDYISHLGDKILHTSPRWGVIFLRSPRPKQTEMWVECDPLCHSGGKKEQPLKEVVFWEGSYPQPLTYFPKKKKKLNSPYL